MLVSIFIYEADIGFMSAKCGLCDKEMPIKANQKATSSEDHIKWFAAQFDLHMKQEHLSEYKIHGRREV